MSDSAAICKLGDRITCHYRLESAGQEIVSTLKDAPETFMLGGGDLAPALEAVLIGMRVGERRVFDVAQAFGEHEPERVQALDRNDFDAQAPLEIGHGVEFNLPNGEMLVGHVVGIEGERVIVDFNHPLAGLTVQFEVSLLAIETTH